jgi:hypothetical protein
VSANKVPAATEVCRLHPPRSPCRPTQLFGELWNGKDRRYASLPISEKLPTTLSQEELFAGFDRSHPGTSDRLVEFLKSCADLQLTWEVKKSLITRMIFGEIKVLPLVVYPNGSVNTDHTFGLKHLLKDYARNLAEALPGAVAKETPKTWRLVRNDGTPVYVWDLLDHQAGCRAALEELNRTLRETAGE